MNDDHASGEAGYTLIEGVVACAIVVVIVLAGAAALVNAIARVTALGQRQNAPVLATQAVERLRAGDVTSGGGLSTGLAKGRSRADVAAQWAGPGAPDLASAWPAYDTAASVSTSAAVPLSSTYVVAGTAYTVSTYLGLCDRVRSSPVDGCRRSAVEGEAPASGSARMVTAVVVVTWTPAAGTSCPASRCSYALSTLLDPSEDLTWRR